MPNAGNRVGSKEVDRWSVVVLGTREGREQRGAYFVVFIRIRFVLFIAPGNNCASPVLETRCRFVDAPISFAARPFHGNVIAMPGDILFFNRQTHESPIAKKFLIWVIRETKKKLVLK